MTEPSKPRGSFRPRAALLWVAALILVVVVLVLAGAGQEVAGILERVDDLGWAGPPLFVLLHSLAVIFLLPGILFPLGAGFLFGTAQGTVYSVAGKMLGSIAAFLIARHTGGQLLAARGRRWSRRYRALGRLARRLPEGGWRTVLLIRLVPAIPFKISNYVFGWSRFTLRDFTIGSFLGAIPFSWINAHLGSLGADLASLDPGRAPRTQTEWLLFALGAAISLGAAAGVVTMAVRILRRGART